MHKKKHNDKVMVIVLTEPNNVNIRWTCDRIPNTNVYLERESPLSQIHDLMPYLTNTKFIIVYDEMVVEEEATPLGLGMEDRDVIFLKSAPSEENYPILLSGVSEKVYVSLPGVTLEAPSFS